MSLCPGGSKWQKTMVWRKVTQGEAKVPAQSDPVSDRLYFVFCIYNCNMPLCLATPVLLLYYIFDSIFISLWSLIHSAVGNCNLVWSCPDPESSQGYQYFPITVELLTAVLLPICLFIGTILFLVAIACLYLIISGLCICMIVIYVADPPAH